MIIYDTEEKLEKHLKTLKKLWLREGVNELNLYPQFCIFHQKNKEKYQLPKEIVLSMALDIFLDIHNADS